MIVNRNFRKRMILLGTIILASSTLPLTAIAQDRSRGWEGSNPNDDPSVVKVPVGDRKTQTPSSPGADDTENVFQAGDVSFKAGRFAEALQQLDQAWRGIGTKQPSIRSTAQFFERKALAQRGLQNLIEAERLLKQALGSVTTNGAHEEKLRSRILFEIADLQSQEGLPRESAVSAVQALKAATTGSVSRMENLLTIEGTNTLGRAMTDIGDIKTADMKLDDALKAAISLEPSGDVNIPLQSSASKFADVITAKIKANKYYLRDTRGNAGKLKRDLQDAISLLRNYSETIAPDTRYSLLTLELEQSEPTRETVSAALTKAAELPGNENLIEAALLMKQAELKLADNDLRGAADVLKRALEIRQKVLPAYSTYIAETLIKMSEVQLKLGRPSDAAANAQRASTALERSAGRKSLHFARASTALASVYVAAGKYSQVEPLLQETVNTLSAIRGRGDAETLRTIDLLCSAYIRNNKHGAAASYTGLALADAEKLYPANSPKLVQSLTNLGTVEAHLKKFAESNAHLQRAQNILMRAGKSNTVEYADVLAAQGVSNTLQKKWGAAQAALRQARTIYTTIYGADSSYTNQMTELLKTMEAMKSGPRIPGHNILLENKFKPSSPQYR
ncbi:tetratricopeptide repeat protein [Candidatus Obscuribacterales bacterium]|nr:tetratricopeptide repeat protein [Candidatus Obscuribacterales bacterium]MBX3151158.1 tetratricopeptide repeat protein [Candidatus Obscuribacterales bacterium]